MKLAVHNVVDRSRRVSYAKCTRLDASDGGRSDQLFAELTCLGDETLCLAFGNALGDDGDNTDRGLVQSLHRRIVRASLRREVDEDVRVRSSGCRIRDGVVDTDGNFLVPEEVLAERVFGRSRRDDGCDRWRFSRAQVVEVKHPLHRFPMSE